MKAAVIAAGRGERLLKGGIAQPKPLVTVNGEPLIARTIRAAANVGATSVACIVNDLYPSVADYMRSTTWPVPLELVVKTTVNSMESLLGLAHLLTEPFILLTVDAIYPFDTLERFVTEAKDIHAAHGVLALTRFVDDEKPLWAKIDSGRRITALGDNAIPTPFVTAGFYYFLPDIFKEMEMARSGNLNALRQFLRHLMENGYALYGLEVPKTIDVDYPEDVEKAEAFLRGADATDS